MDLRSLQSGAQVTIQHDEHNTGNFIYLAGPFPISMLMYFSGVLHQQLNQRNAASPCPYGHLMGLTPCPNIQIRGHDASALKDLFVWMQACMRAGTVQSLSNTVNNDPVRHVLALSCVRALDIRTLDQEVPTIAKRLEGFVLTCEQISRLMATQSLLPVLRSAVIGHVARQFCLGTLLDPSGHIMLGRLNPAFDKEVAMSLKDLREKRWHIKAQIAEGIWICKSLDDFRNKLAGNVSQQQQSGTRQSRPFVQAPAPPQKPTQTSRPAAPAQHATMPVRQTRPVQTAAQAQNTPVAAQHPLPPNHPPLTSAVPQSTAIPPVSTQSNVAYAYPMGQPSMDDFYRSQQMAQGPYLHAAQSPYSHTAIPVAHAAMYQPYGYSPMQVPMVHQAYPVYDQLSAQYQQYYAPQYVSPRATVQPAYCTSGDSSATQRPKSPRPRRENSHRRQTSTPGRDKHVHFESDQPKDSSDDRAYVQQHRRRRSSSHRHENASSSRATGSLKNSFWQTLYGNHN